MEPWVFHTFHAAAAAVPVLLMAALVWAYAPGEAQTQSGAAARGALAKRVAALETGLLGSFSGAPTAAAPTTGAAVADRSVTEATLGAAAASPTAINSGSSPRPDAATRPAATASGPADDPFLRNTVAELRQRLHTGVEHRWRCAVCGRGRGDGNRRRTAAGATTR
jgi:hypothetical protein